MSLSKQAMFKEMEEHDAEELRAVDLAAIEAKIQHGLEEISTCGRSQVISDLLQNDIPALIEDVRSLSIQLARRL